MSKPETQPADKKAPGKPDERVADLAKRLLDGGLYELTAREQRVISTIADRHHVTRSVNRTVDDGKTIGDHIADRVARFGGSWTFIIIFVAALAAWVGLNTLMGSVRPNAPLVSTVLLSPPPCLAPANLPARSATSTPHQRSYGWSL